MAEQAAAVAGVTIADVLARMRAIGTELPAADGVACFNRLYLAVTETVEEAMPLGRFRSPAFLAHLDVRFAELFFAALDDPPRAWAPLFEARGRRGIAPIQFALAGMNAHINRDLPVALAATWEELGLAPRRGGHEHRDFLAVNALLSETEARVKRDFAAGVLGDVDQALGNVDDVIAMWNVRRARDAAWTNAEALWELRRTPELADAFLLALDRMVGLAGRGLLRPVARPPLWRRLRARVARLIRPRHRARRGLTGTQTSR